MRINYVPWWGKIAAKIVLTRLKIPYIYWSKFGLFQHGEMDAPSYAYRVFKQHFDNVKLPEKFVSLELGPGDSLFSAIISQAFGGSTSYLVDSGDFARKDIDLYRAMANFITQKELPTPNIQELKSLEEVLNCCSANYLTSGLTSLRTIPAQSVDYIWSNAVLEHVRKKDFLDTMLELRRIIRNNGVCSHQVDLKDHLSNALNNLRFPEHIWENEFMANSGFYTNRIQYSQMLDIFRQANFDVEIIKVERWDKLPVLRAKLSKEFRQIRDEELCISGFSVRLRPSIK
ncbi:MULTISPECIES: class I SAM-dependent methyltransferase [Cyanophyceae]|uniref:class I SAM-dependent methyltransferase n=1 Tax=Cyanophyceae TaxID=3028117 RepID=UPI00168916A2|nr:class I SAM-dependent methyltransferase [Trichocoleus sp. FACHB-40]MBD2002395.1 methyltransferase domain-containing protein [Trichocoleus sp. FACHB-40]